LEAVVIVSASKKSLEEHSAKRMEVMKRIVNGIKTVTRVSGEPVSFYSYVGEEDGSGSRSSGGYGNKVVPHHI